jgi:nucleoside-diphosphate-sugar epimerase
MSQPIVTPSFGIVEPIRSVEELEDRLSEPTAEVIETLGRLPGDLLVLGVAGKMGPTLARMALRASQAGGVKRRVIGVSRFSDALLEPRLKGWGIETIRADLLDQRQLDALPDAPNVIAMTGMKFGSTGQAALTWAMNVYLAGMVCQRFRHSRIVAFSTGNVYPLSPVHLGGSREDDSLGPVGEYAMTALGRERMLEHFSRVNDVPLVLLRLNYANELRYGVLSDLARRVWREEPIDVTMGNFNALWQGDANAMALRAFDHLATPPYVVNLAGPETLSVRRVCEALGRLMNKPVELVGNEAPDALLSSGQRGHRLFGYPRVSVEQMLQWIAAWVMRDGETLGKPTHFEVRDGKF